MINYPLGPWFGRNLVKRGHYRSKQPKLVNGTTGKTAFQDNSLNHIKLMCECIRFPFNHFVCRKDNTLCHNSVSIRALIEWCKLIVNKELHVNSKFYTILWSMIGNKISYLLSYLILSSLI